MEDKLIDKVVRLEWEMFTSVQNSGRRASCQEDWETFRIMRRSQECEWPEALLAAYHDDLVAAGEAGRNLMSEKYAWMMESTFPKEFEKISGLLPPVGAEELKLIEEIVAVNVDWKLELCERYPRLGGRGRAVRTAEDSLYETSFETYLRGELKTYSPKTLALLHAFTLERKAAGVNSVERDLLNQVRHYGFDGLQQAEDCQ